MVAHSVAGLEEGGAEEIDPVFEVFFVKDGSTPASFIIRFSTSIHYKN